MDPPSTVASQAVPFAGRLQISFIELAGIGHSGTYAIQATAMGVTSHGKHWSRSYRTAYQPASAVQVTPSVRIGSANRNVAVNFDMTLPLIGPVSRQFIVVELRRVPKCLHGTAAPRTIGLARILLHPLMEGAADGHGKEHTLWLEFTTLSVLAHLDDARLECSDMHGASAGAADEGGEGEACVGHRADSASCVLGRLKIMVKLSVDRAANAAACHRPEQPYVVPYPPFSASRLLHALAEAADHVVNPISEGVYDAMGVVNWELPHRTLAYLYLWMTLVIYVEWAMVLLHALVLFFLFWYPVDMGCGLTDLMLLLMNPAENAPARSTEGDATHYTVRLVRASSDIGLHRLPHHHHLGPYPSVRRVKKRAEARQQGVRVGDLLTKINGLGVGGESIDVVMEFLKDLEQSNPGQPVELTFKRRVAGVHAATARRLAADATAALGSVIAKSGSAAVAGGRTVVNGVTRSFGRRGGRSADAMDNAVEDLEAAYDK